MTYTVIDQLVQNPQFRGRVTACCLVESETYRDDQRPAWQAMAADFIAGGGVAALTFVRLAASAPGFADKVAVADPEPPAKPLGTIDQGQVSDGEILGVVQQEWPYVAELHFGQGKEVST